MINALNFIYLKISSIDCRSLVLFRITLGMVLLYDLFDRSLNLTTFYTNEGVLPNHFNLFRPTEAGWSLFNCLSTNAEVVTGFILTGFFYLSFMVGYGGFVTRLMTLLLTMSLSTRNLFLEHGGHLVLMTVLSWCLFLPLERYFSLTSWLNHKKGESKSWHDLDHPKIYRSCAIFGILCSLATIYYFNNITKTGDNWTNGTAIWYSLNLSQHTTEFGFWLRQNSPVMILALMSYLAIIIEIVLPFLILSPIFTTLTRTLAIIGIWMLHGGIYLTLEIGIFPLSLMSYSLIMIPSKFWDWILKTRSNEPERLSIAEVKYSLLSNSMAMAMLLCFSLQAFQEYSEFKNGNNAYKAPYWVSIVTQSLRTKQSWRMFAPSVPQKDYAVLIEGEDDNGRHFDVANGRALNINSQEDLQYYFEVPQHRNVYWIHWELRMLFLPFRSDGGFVAYYTHWLNTKYPTIKKFWVHHIERDTPAPERRTEKNIVTIKTLFLGERGRVTNFIG